ncbi:MAG: iron-containing alcohol dehydrogenase, partial [Desulfobacterales bacterium]
VTVLLFLPYELQIYSKATDRHLKLCEMLSVREKDSDEQSLANLIEKIRDFARGIHLPVGLKDAGVAKGDFEKQLDFILDQTPTDPAFYFGWFDLTREQLKDVFLSAYQGTLLDMCADIWR